MKKKKIGILGIILIILVSIFETYNINLETLYNYFINDNPTIEEIDNDIPTSKVLNSDLKVYYLDVGQADCILIQNENDNMLIDAGNNEDGSKLVNYLKSLGITNFKYVVGTHPHEDLIGGLDNIIKEFNVEKVLLPDAYTTTATFEDVLIALEDKNLNFEVPNIGKTLSLGEARIEIIHTESNPEDLNDSSIVLRLDYGENSFLFSGDATSTIEKKILNKNIAVDIYKVAHHGSSYSNSESFLNKVNPSIGIISAGKNNSYNHPHLEVVKRLEERNIKLYRTDKLGTILVTSDGKNYDITSFKTDTNG